MARLEGAFDYVFSCSVFEHIHPEEDGDLVAAAHLPILLRPGGRAVISVPYARQGFCEYVESGTYTETRSTAEPIFFQRFYDAARLDRLVRSSGLEPEAREFVGECDPATSDPRDRVALRLGTGWRRILLGRRFWRQARRYLTPPVGDPNQLEKPYLAFVRLRRPLSLPKARLSRDHGQLSKRSPSRHASKPGGGMV
jgi:SAM-dependent methyltransferase